MVSPLLGQDVKGKPDADAPITKEQAAKIVEELQMIRMLLERDLNARAKDGQSDSSVNTAQNAVAEVGNNVLGSDKAPVTLLEFVDLQCPFCMQFRTDILPKLKEKYIANGKLRFAVVDFPLPSHAYSLPAAIFARCAGSQGKYWQVYEAFLSSPDVAVPEMIDKLAADLHLNRQTLDRCKESTQTADEVSKGVDAARSLGVTGTPTLVLGKSQQNRVTGGLIEGSPSLAALETQIDKLLGDSSAETRPPSSSAPNKFAAN